MSIQINDNEELSLFICCTPLQGLIAKRIIQEKNIRPEKCSIFYYTSHDNAVYRETFEELEKLSNNAIFFHWKPNFPKYFYTVKKLARNLTYNTIYLASIDSILAQILLSQKKHRKIYTFDDGTANIVKGSCYHSGLQSDKKKRTIFWLLGNRYCINKIKKETSIHYTIYKNIENITPHPIYLTLFKKAKDLLKKEKECTVILGSVFDEIFNIENKEILLNRMCAVINSRQGEIYYIPHPRDSTRLNIKAERVDSKLIAEKIIFDLAKSYSTINLFGFSSSAQLNLSSETYIKNYFFKFKEERRWVEEVRDICERISLNKIEIVNI